jgi:hypothetical protein
LSDPPPRITALVSSYKSLLLIHADPVTRDVLVRPIDTDKGIYFGLTGYRTGALVAARNLDTSRRQGNRAHGTNVIYYYDPRLGTVVPYLTHPILTDLHEIRHYGDLLFVVLGTGSQLAVFDLRSRQLIQTIALAPFIPDHLRHDGGRHPEDPYHFNAIALTGARLVVLAHNWDRGSFALDFHLRLGPPVSLDLAAVHEALGFASHDVVLADGKLHVLDGEGGRLIARGGANQAHDIGNRHGPPFPRGLSITREHILIGYGSWSAEPFTRLRSQTRLCLLRRDNWAMVMDGEIGPHGNPTDILVLSHPDESDSVRV